MHGALDYCFLSVYSNEYSFILSVASSGEINFEDICHQCMHARKKLLTKSFSKEISA